MKGDIDPRFAETIFLVEATFYEQLALWKEWKDKILWEEDSSGKIYLTGELDNRPIYTSMSWARINGQLVLFYENTSIVVDNDQVENWFKEHCCPKWDNNTRRAKCDAINFQHCISAIKEKAQNAKGI